MAMDEIRKPKGDAAHQEEDSPKEKESNSEQPPRTLAEQKKAVEDAVAQYGDKVKREQINPITEERDTLKSKVETFQSDLTDNTAEIEKLEAKLSDLTSDDPERFDVVKELKAAREDRKQLKADRQAFETEKASVAESKVEVDKWNRDQLVYKAADEFVTASGENVDFDSFMSAADKFKVSEREGLIALAETMGFKPKSKAHEDPENPPLKPYSGVTEGGTGFAYDPKDPDKTLKQAFRERKK